MKRLASLLLSALLVFSLTACGNPAGKGEAETDEFLSQLEGSYVELFPELGKDEYHEKWVTHVEPIVGEAATEETIAFLLNMCTAEIYGDEAVEAYKNPDDMRFDCYFLGGVDKFTISGNVISGVDENGKEVFSHTYSPFENKEDTGFLYYKTDDEDAGQFTYLRLHQIPRKAHIISSFVMLKALMTFKAGLKALMHIGMPQES